MISIASTNKPRHRHRDDHSKQSESATCTIEGFALAISIRNQHCVIRNLKFYLFAAALLLFTHVQAHAQNLPSSTRKNLSQHEQVIQLSSKLAETLLIHKEAPACQKGSDGVRVTGTVVIEITIDKTGKVNRPHIISGPKMLRPLATAAVRKYRYKPYLLNNASVEVETVVSVQLDCYFHTGQA